jgi:hypothetical protein
MTYERLADFIQNRMRMSHVYQPVMLMALLRAGGRASTRDIARSILAHDESQVEYYGNVTKNMVGRVLRNHLPGKLRDSPPDIRASSTRKQYGGRGCYRAPTPKSVQDLGYASVSLSP